MSTATPDWLDLPAPPRVVFERPPLALVLCQVRYAPMLNVSQPTSVAAFQQAILDDYPLTSQEQNVKIQVEGNLNQASVQSNLGSIAWRFTDTDDGWTVVLTPEFVTLETRAYNDFSEFLARLGRLLRALTKHIRPTVGLRIGLRYVNELRPDQMDWGAVIRAELLGPLGVPPIAERATQAIQQLTVRGPGVLGVNISHGLLPSGSVVAPRSDTQPRATPFYLLDIDVYEDFKPGTLAMKVGPLCDRVEQYHEVVSRLFRWSVTEAYTATLGRRGDGMG